MKLNPFYPILDNADWLERLVPLGIKLVQLRSKDLSEAETRQEIIRSRDICAKHDCQLIVNDYWQIAIDEGCDYVHLGQEDLDDADVKAIRAANIKLGISTHDHAELERALSLDPDYVALGPVYPTILKKMKWTEQGLDRVTEWKTLVGDIPLVGIGGLSVERAPGVLQAGADIVSVVTDITLNADPEKRTREWIDVTRSAL
ncbi:MAG: thiamine phosphate synthase [Rhizobiaceae bacterium]|nr:thiamine phosphate synthase [Rhizobiaceae bacterium]